MVVPILIYGCEVWGFCNLDPIEIFYRKFLKMILKLWSSTPSCQVYGESGQLPIKFFIQKRIIAFWIKISEDKPQKFSSILYKLTYKLHSSRKAYYSWIENVKNILESCHFSNLWEHQDEYDKKSSLKNIVFKSLEAIYTESWQHQTFNNQYCVIYCMFKDNLKLENYLLMSKLTIAQKTTLLKFRVGNNKLPIQKYKFSRLNADKFCPFCHGVEMGFFIGNELHFLFECSTFANERSSYLKPYFYQRPNAIKIYELFNSRNIKVLKNLSLFVNIIMEKFN